MIKSRTVVSNAWIQRELEMGHRSNVSRAMSFFRVPQDPIRKRLKR